MVLWCSALALKTQVIVDWEAAIVALEQGTPCRDNATGVRSVPQHSSGSRACLHGPRFKAAKLISLLNDGVTTGCTDEDDFNAAEGD